jgi:2-oxoglutarate dehydrogenase E1 component
MSDDYYSLKDESLWGAGSDYLEDLFEQAGYASSELDGKWQSRFSDLNNTQGGTQSSVPLSVVREKFTNLKGRSNQASVTPGEQADSGSNLKQNSVTNLINSYRLRGHHIAQIDPLKMMDKRDIIELSLEGNDLSEKDLNTLFNPGALNDNKPLPLDQIIQLLQKIYCRSLGVEYMHIGKSSEKAWIREYVEGLKGNLKPSTEQQKQLLKRLNMAESIEKHLHTQYVGQKRFSLEGGESLILCLDAILENSGKAGVNETVVGMAHRGRLNVLVNIFGKSPQELFEEFEGKKRSNLLSGDVKYHQGFSSDLLIDGNPMHIALAFNPSHLEIVGPVVAGSVRSRQDKQGDRTGSKVLPIVIHGDAAFAGQGVVMETLNMSESRGYTTRGTIHIIINNQIGFTTSFAQDARSTLYCTDVAKMLNIPILHVNADDPEAVHFASKLAIEYRQKFQKDVVLDLVCYRRHGHNEADEPAVTQPNMYRIVRATLSTRNLYAQRLIEQKIISEKDDKQWLDQAKKELSSGTYTAPFVIQNTEKKRNKTMLAWLPYLGSKQDIDSIVDTTFDKKKLQEMGKKISTLPVDFNAHSRANNILKQRVEMAQGTRLVDWGFAENLAYATLLKEGFDIRITGQDVRRGTFFHRHATFHDTKVKQAYTPLKKLDDTQPSFTIIDSMLSEEAVLAFEYGYASSSPNSLVVWEAQFGDFANGAQVVIDQFISSGEAKWGRYCGLVMLLPHGYEGQGPEHSSARVERYFQLCAEDNIRLVVPSTPQQMFHLLRHQMLVKVRKPLIVMTPKSLLRLPEAVCSLDDLAKGSFEPVLDDLEVKEPNEISDIVFCSGKIYYELREQQQKYKLKNVALVRLERYYPFPYQEVLDIINRYKNTKVIRWCQEEPKNQGGWRSLTHRFDRVIQKSNHSIEHIVYVGRSSSASPAVGSIAVHKEQQQFLIDQALGMKELLEGNQRWRRVLGNDSGKKMSVNPSL